MGFDPIKDLPDLTGKVAIVTGGNSGIGFAVVQQLARKGAKVYLAARNESKATGALARLDAEGRGPGNGEVVWLKLDLSDPKAAKQAAANFASKETRLDILVNNAAVILVPFNVGPTGIQDSMLVNHFSPFVFTQQLLPLLTQTAKEPNADVRIVNVSAHAHRLVPKSVRFRSKADFNVDYKNKYLDRMTRYGASKLANILWTNELQRRFDADGVPVICISLHPGAVNTEGSVKFALSLPLSRLMLWIGSTFLYTSAQGGHTPVIAAASPVVRAEAEKYKAAYLMPGGKIGTKSETARSEELAKELWESTEALLREMEVY